MRKPGINIRTAELYLNQQGYQDLAVLRARLRVPSKSEVLRLGLCVLSWVVEELEAGHKIIVQKQQGRFVGLSFDFLKVKPKRRRHL